MTQKRQRPGWHQGESKAVRGGHDQKYSAPTASSNSLARSVHDLWLRSTLIGDYREAGLLSDLELLSDELHCLGAQVGLLGQSATGNVDQVFDTIETVLLFARNAYRSLGRERLEPESGVIH